MLGGGMLGIIVVGDVFIVYQVLQKNKEYSFIVFKIQDEKIIIVVEKGDKSLMWDDLIFCLFVDNGVYVVYDLLYKVKLGVENIKFILIIW